MKMMYRAVFFLFALQILSACAPVGQPKIIDIDSFKAVGPQPTECAIQRLQVAEQDISTFRSLVNMTIDDNYSRYDIKEVVIFERPDRARIEFLRPGINQVESMLLIRDGEIVAYSISKQIGYRGEASGENLFRLIGVPLDPDELMLWLTGRVNVVDASELRLSMSPDNNYLLEMKTVDGRRMFVTLDTGAQDICQASALRLKQMEIVGGEVDLGFHCTYKYAENAGKVEVPRLIEFELAEIDLRGKLLFDSPVLNVDLSKKRERLFHGSLPPSIEFQQIENMDETSVLLPIQ